MRSLFLTASMLVAATALAVEPRTIVESTEYARTSLYAEVVGLVEQIAATSDIVTITPLTTSPEGRMVPLVVLSRERVRTPAELRATGKPAVLVMANIHAGEIEGKEAAQMLIRDVASGKLGALLEHQVILVIPIFNADGNDKLGKNRRDAGPELAGVRHNGQYLDLNRDYAKLDSPEVRALVRLFAEWDPLLFMDLHTTNGSYHREPVSYATSSSPNAARVLQEYMWQRLFPAAAASLKREDGWDSIPYGEFTDSGDPTKGWSNDTVDARYGTNYFGLRNRLAILDENYSYADFKTRVLACFGYVRAVLAYTDAHAAEILTLTRQADQETRRSYAGQPFVVESTLEKLFDVTVKSYEFRKEAVTAEERARRPWLGPFRLRPTEATRDYTVPYLALAAPKRSIPVPVGYAVLPGQDEAVGNLQAHGIAVEQLTSACTVAGERFVIEKIEPAKTIYQGRVLLTLSGKYEKAELELPAGSFFVDLHQPLARLVPVLLEPESADSLAVWGFFNRAIVRQWSNEPAPYPVLRVAQRPAVPLITPRSD